MNSQEAVIASRIIEVLKSCPLGRMPGSLLADELRSSSEYSPQIHGRLKDFIDTHVSAVRRVGQRGKDWIYALNDNFDLPEVPLTIEDKGRTPETPNDELRCPRALQNRSERETSYSPILKLPQDVWKTFAGPRSPFRLYGNRVTGSFAIRTSSDEPNLDEEWVYIPPCSQEKLSAMACAFVSTVQDEARRGVLNRVVKGGSGPGSSFYQTVIALGLVEAWGRFRREGVLKEFEVALKKVGIPIQPVIRVSKPFQVLGPPVAMAQSAIPPIANPSRVRTVRRDELKRVALAVVERMSEAELRSLSLPFGYTFDMLSQ